MANHDNSFASLDVRQQARRMLTEFCECNGLHITSSILYSIVHYAAQKGKAKATRCQISIASMRTAQTLNSGILAMGSRAAIVSLLAGDSR